MFIPCLANSSLSSSGSDFSPNINVLLHFNEYNISRHDGLLPYTAHLEILCIAIGEHTDNDPNHIELSSEHPFKTS